MKLLVIIFLSVITNTYAEERILVLDSSKAMEFTEVSNFENLKLSGYNHKVMKTKLWKSIKVINFEYIKYEWNKPIFSNCFPAVIPKVIDIEKTGKDPRTREWN